MSVFVAEVARPTLVFRRLLGQAEPILITGGRAVADYREAFVGIDVAKLKNAIAVAESGGEGEIRFWGEVDASDISMRRVIQRIAAKSDRVHFCYEAGPTGYGLHRLIRSLGHECVGRRSIVDPQEAGRQSKDEPSRCTRSDLFGCRRRSEPSDDRVQAEAEFLLQLCRQIVFDPARPVRSSSSRYGHLGLAAACGR